MKKTASGVAPNDRLRVLEDGRRRKMARSAHAYVRGNTLKFYEWLHAIPRHTLPEGPSIWICGDCHVGNLGPVADSEGHIEIEVRDLDQTVVGNPAHDLIRLGLSLAMAARGSDLPGVTTAHMIEHMLAGYEKALTAPTRAPKLKKGEVRPIETILQQALKRRWHHLAEERIEDVKPTIPLGQRFWALAPKERAAIDELFASPEVCTLVTSLNKSEAAKIKVLDAAYWMKGCSSLGRLRFAALLGLGRKSAHHYSLIDIKEAVPAAAPSTRRFNPKEDFAVRVVTGARALSPFLGERMMATTLLRRSVVVRELMPQDLKLEIDRLTCDEAVAAAEYLASVVGKAHARQMDAVTRKRWRAELNRNRSKSLEAPGWMWKAVVELVASHEAGYLEHCRRYAIG
jgi:uncharacterized protein (DUF2252 family)